MTETAPLLETTRQYDEACQAFRDAQDPGGDYDNRDYEYYEDAMVQCAHDFASGLQDLQPQIAEALIVLDQYRSPDPLMSTTDHYAMHAPAVADALQQLLKGLS